MKWRRSGTDRFRTLTLHVGTPKSATTYLQAVLCAARPELTRRRILYPGAAYLPAAGLNQQPAVYAYAGPEVRWISDAVRERGRALMPKVAEELAKTPGDVLISAEALASFSSRGARELVDALAFAPEQSRVVVTVRDFGRLVSSVWQENVKNGATSTLSDYLDSVAGLRGAGESPFWNAYGLPGLVDRWAEVVGLENVSIVTVPHADRREELWPRFCRAIGAPDLPLPPTSHEHKRNNVSLTASQSELLREMNAILEIEDLTHRDRQKVRERLLNAWMAAPDSPGRQLSLPAHLVEPVARWAEEDIAGLAERADRGLTVEGDLEELRPRPPGSGPGTAPTLAEAAQDLLTLVRHGQSPTGQG